MTRPELRDRLDLEEGGSWAVSTEAGKHWQAAPRRDEKRIVPLAVDTGHSYPLVDAVDAPD